jgi:hypothetical protein
LPNERKELPTPIQYPRASDKRAVATTEGTKDGNDGGDIAAFSGVGFLDIGTRLSSSRRIGSLEMIGKTGECGWHKFRFFFVGPATRGTGENPLKGP